MHHRLLRSRLERESCHDNSLWVGSSARDRFSGNLRLTQPVTSIHQPAKSAQGPDSSTETEAPRIVTVTTVVFITGLYNNISFYDEREDIYIQYIERDTPENLNSLIFFLIESTKGVVIGMGMGNRSRQHRRRRRWRRVHQTVSL